MQSGPIPELPHVPILIVDDFRSMGCVIETLLRQAGFQNVMHVRGVRPALEALQRQFFGVVLSDWELERSSGLDLLRRLRNDPALSHVRFILMSAHGDPDLPATVCEIGGHGFLRKPFTADAARAMIAEVLAL
jgi:two-component system, chemotaxis family, chemotaxis protein CheY